MEWASEKYKNNLMEYEKRDGIKAIIIILPHNGQCIFSWLALYNKYKCACIKFITSLDSSRLDFTFACFFHTTNRK